MALSRIQRLLASLGLTFTPPTETAMQVELAENEFQKLLLTGLGAVAQGSAGTRRTPTSTTVTADGAVAAGAIHAEFILSSDFVGTINGNAFTGAVDAQWATPLLPKGDTYPAIPYTISAGSIRLTVVT